LKKYFNQDMLVAMAVWQLVIPMVATPLCYRLAIFARTPPVPFHVVFKGVFLSIGLNMILPARLSEFAKPLFLYNKEKVPISNGLGAIFAERILDVVVLALLAGVALCETYIELSYQIIVTLLAIPIAVFLTLLFFDSIILKVVAYLPYKPVKEFVENILTHTFQLIKQRRFYYGFALSVLGWVGATLCYYIFFRLVGSIPLSYFEAVAVFVTISLAYAIPALPAGIGAYEAGAVFALMTFGYTAEESLALAIVLHISTFLTPLLITIWIIFREDMKLSEFIQDLKSRFYTKESG